MSHAAPLGSRQTVNDILRSPPWRNVDQKLVAELLKTKKIKPLDIRDLDGYLKFREIIEDDKLTSSDVLNRIVVFGTDSRGVEKLRRARKAIMLLFEANELSAELAEAISSISRRKPPSRSKSPGRPLQHSVGVTELPQNWRLALADMMDGLPGENDTAPAPEIVKGISRTMRQVAKTALDEQLPIVLTKELAIAYERSLKQRQVPLSPHTVTKYIQDIMEFAAYIGSSSDLQKHLLERFRRHARRSDRAPTRLDFRVAKVPDCQVILSMALGMIEDAKSTVRLQSAHALRNRAAAIALVAPLPLRIADLTLHFGCNITWNGEQYHLHIPETSKPKQAFSTTIHPVFGAFIDQLVLHERPASQLENTRQACLRDGRALFVNQDGQPVHRNYVSRAWWTVFGTGSHVARAKLHDEFSRLGSRGVELAMAACGHRSEASAEFYRSRAFDTHACEYVRDRLLADISDDEFRQYFN